MFIYININICILIHTRISSVWLLRCLLMHVCNACNIDKSLLPRRWSNKHKPTRILQNLPLTLSVQFSKHDIMSP